MERTRKDPIAFQRDVILALLIGLSVLAWAVMLGLGAGHGPHALAAAPSMGLGAPLFIAVWLAMTVAMMFPTAAPMALTFHKIQIGKRDRGQAFIGTWAFLAGYLLVWIASGFVAYAGAVAAERLGAYLDLSDEASARIGGGLLIAAGLYQVTPLKDMCLTKCRTPLSFIMTSWRDGTLGALKMGAIHGAWCVGCCWLLCVIMFPLGMMNAAVLASVTLIIFIEKTLPWGALLGSALGAILFAYGFLIIVHPHSLQAFAM